MEVFSQIEDLPAQYRGSVIAIGNFDGVHKGHQLLLGKARQLAREQNKPFGVVTFEPHPRHLFRPDDPPFRITTLPVKLRRLDKTGADFCLLLNFDWDLASKSADDFMEELLDEGISAGAVAVGSDFRFGQLRKGNVQMLERVFPNVCSVEPGTDESGEKYSSSRIRALLRHDKIKQANELLGWEWEMEGKVVHGDKRGQELGFPTANVPLAETLHPGYGVYAAWVKIEGEDIPWLPSATNVGIRPMFEIAEGQVEAHILDFNRDIYHKILRIRPVKKIRGEARFPSVKELIVQMEKDCEEVRAILGKTGPFCPG